MRAVLTHVALHVDDLDACLDFYRSYCGMRAVHERPARETGERVIWLSEPGRERELIFVLIPGGRTREETAGDFSHLGFALPDREAVDAVAVRARAEGRLIWEPVQEPYPVGYYCGVRDPDGNQVEFSFGQPLGPGAQRRE